MGRPTGVIRCLPILFFVAATAGCGSRTALDDWEPPADTDDQPDARVPPPSPTDGGLDGGEGVDGGPDGGTTPAPDGAMPRPPRTDPGPSIQHLSAGWRHTCAVDHGQVFCWGYNGSGQLGDGTFVDRHAPVPVSGLDDVVEISAGLQHTCAARRDGSMWCWGNNSIGQLGDGGFEPRARPSRVGGVGDVIDIAAGGEHTCALSGDGTVRCWGHNAYGQVGDGTMVVRLRPVVVPGLDDAVQISATRRKTCTLHADGAVRCWGDFELRPREEMRDHRFVQLAGDCALRAGGAVTCYAVSDARHVAVSESGVCVAREDAAVSCDGLAVPGTEGAYQVSRGYEHACAMRTDDVVCWGRDELGQLGDGPTPSGGRTVPVLGL